jgi:hypothetical protein
MTTYYVTTSGSDSNNGLTEGTAFATPGYAASQATTAGDIVYVKEGTYTLTTTTVNASGGPVSIAARTQMEGYKTTIGDQAARPIINAGSQAVANMVTFAYWNYNITLGPAVRSIEVDGNSVATTGIYAATPGAALVDNCIAKNLGNGVFGGYITGCSSENCTNGILLARDVSYSFAKSCATGFYRNESLFRCIAYNGTGIGISFLSDGERRAHQCVAYNNSSHGFYNGYDRCNLVGCVSVNNGGYGYAVGTSSSDAILIDCADYNNTSGRTITSNPTRDIRPINLTGDPFTNPSGDDFSLNNIAGAGADLRQVQLSGLAGVNSVFDVGAIDAVVTAGGGGATVHPLYAN